MQQRTPVGVVVKDGDTYVGTCDEVGTTSTGRTVAEAFANLQAATWRQLALHNQQEQCGANHAG